MNLSAAIVCTSMALLPQPARSAANWVYFSQDGSSQNAIHRLGTDGGTLQTIQDSGLDGPVGVAVDLIVGKVYWADLSLGVIQRRNIDGAGVVETVIDANVGPFDVALDVPHGKLYFSDRGTPTLDAALKRADLDGGNVETLIEGTAPAYIELDLVHGKIYFTHGGSAPTFISRANLDGTDSELIYSAETDVLRGIALDLRDRRIYFGLVSQLDGSFRISRSYLNGTGQEDFLTDLPEVGHDLAIDAEARQLYWSFSEGVHRANLDNTDGIETVVSGVQGSSLWAGIGGLALDLQPPIAACRDGIDNDADGLTDYPSDPHCWGPQDATERRSRCGLGFELVIVLPLLVGAQSVRRRSGG